MSAEYKIFETAGYAEDLESLKKAGARNITTKLEAFVYPQLRAEPHFGPNIKKLRNWAPPIWRYRVGNWRFFYEIDEQEIIVYLIAAYHRGEAYRP